MDAHEEEAVQSLGIDVGGSGIKGAIVETETGELISERIRIATPEGARPGDMTEAVKSIVQTLSWQGHIGMGFPSVVMHGVILTAANIDSSWIGVNAEQMLFDSTGLQFHILNDADAAGIAEMRFGIGRERSRGVVLFLTIGTGIGSAIFVDGTLVPNTELGHLEVRGKDAEHRASDAVRQSKKLDWESWAERLQEVLTTYDKLLWPDLIIIGGGVSKEWRKFMPFIKLRVEVLPARLLNQAGIIGAALYANQFSGVEKKLGEAISLD